MRGLDARALQNSSPAVGGQGCHRDIQVVAQGLLNKLNPPGRLVAALVAVELMILKLLAERILFLLIAPMPLKYPLLGWGWFSKIAYAQTTGIIQ